MVVAAKFVALTGVVPHICTGTLQSSPSAGIRQLPSSVVAQSL